MAATLGQGLVLQLNGVGAIALEQADGALHVEGVAISSVGVDDHWQIDALPHQADDLGHLVHRHQANIRPPEAGVGDTGAGHIDRRKAGLGGHHGAEGVKHTGRNDNFGRGDLLTKGRGHGGKLQAGGDRQCHGSPPVTVRQGQLRFAAGPPAVTRNRGGGDCASRVSSQGRRSQRRVNRLR